MYYMTTSIGIERTDSADLDKLKMETTFCLVWTVCLLGRVLAQRGRSCGCLSEDDGLKVYGEQLSKALPSSKAVSEKLETSIMKLQSSNGDEDAECAKSAFRELQTTHNRVRSNRLSAVRPHTQESFRRIRYFLGLSPFVSSWIQCSTDLALLVEELRLNSAVSEMKFENLTDEMSSVKAQVNALTAIVGEQNKNDDALLLGSLGFETAKAALLATEGAFGEVKIHNNGTTECLATISDLHGAYKDYKNASIETRLQYAEESNSDRRANRHMIRSEVDKYEAFLDKVFLDGKPHSTKSAQLIGAIKRYKEQRVGIAHPELKESDFRTLKNASKSGNILVGDDHVFKAVIEFMERRKVGRVATRCTG